MSKCLLCAASSVRQVSDTAPQVYFHCRECDLIFLDPAFHLPAAEEKKRYDTHNNTLDNPGYVAMFERFLHTAVLPFAPPGVAALDFGSGPGPVLQVLLKRQGFQADVYDPFFAPQQPAGPYPLITSTEALEHVFAPQQAWQQLMTLLAEQGILAIMTHFHQGPEDFSKWWYRRDCTHVIFFSEQTFAWLAKAFSLKRLYSDGKKTITLQKL